MSDKHENKNPAAQIVHSLISAGGKVGEMIGVKQPAPKKPNRIKLLMSVVNPSDEGKLKEILDDISVSLSCTFTGTGTARSQLLDYLGIGESVKSVVVSLIPESDEDAILKVLRTRMALYLVGKGISFTLPLTGISEITANGLLKAATNKTTEGKKIMTNQDRKYDLIVAAVEAGRVDEALEAARSAGAAGGKAARKQNSAGKTAPIQTARFPSEAQSLPQPAHGKVRRARYRAQPALHRPVRRAAGPHGTKTTRGNPRRYR